MAVHGGSRSTKCATSRAAPFSKERTNNEICEDDVNSQALGGCLMNEGLPG